MVIRRLGGVASGVLSLAALLVLAVPSDAAGVGSIGGTVTAQGDGPLAGIQVQVLNEVWGTVVATIATDASGTYSKALLAGSYVVRFRDPSGVRADRYSGGATTFGSASRVTVSSGPTTVNAAMQLGDSVAGAVVDANGVPAPGIVVELLDADQFIVATDVTAADGSYLLAGVPASPHTVRFTDPTATHGMLYAGGSRTFAGASSVTGTGTGAVHVFDQALVLAGSLSGRATIGAFGPGVTGAFAVVVDATVSEILAFAALGSDGSWSVAGIAPGGVKVLYVDQATLGELTNGLRPIYLPDRDLRKEGAAAAHANASTYAVAAGAEAVTDPGRLRGADCDPGTRFPGANLTSTNLSGEDLRGCDLDGARFARSNLTNTDLRFAELAGARFGDLGGFGGFGPIAITWDGKATTTGTRFTGARMANAIIDTPQFRAAHRDWSGADLTDTGDLNWWGFYQCESIACSGLYPGIAHIRFDGMDLAGAIPAYDFRGTTFARHGFVAADLAGMDLSGIGCVGCDLSGADLDGAFLGGATLTSAKVTGASLVGTTLTAAQLLATDHDWTGIDLTGWNLSGQNLQTYTMDGANLTNALLAFGNLYNVSARGANFTNTNLWGTVIQSTKFDGATGLTRARLQLANKNWSFTSFAGTGLDLSGMSFAGHVLSFVNFSGVNLSGATLSGRSMLRGNLTSANLTNAALVGTELTRADLSGANLTGAVLTGAAIQEANFDGASGLTAASITATSHNWTLTRLTNTGLDLSGTDFAAGGYLLAAADLSGLDLSSSTLSGRNLRNARLVGATLDSADLDAADLTEADATNASFASASMVGVKIDNYTAVVGADFSFADLTGATFAGDASGAVFTSATMTNARIALATFTNATGLTVAQLLPTQASWNLAKFDGTGLDFSGTDLRSKTLSWTTLVGISLAGANLTNVPMNGSKLAGSNVAGANLSGALMTNASGAPPGGATAVYSATTCPDGVVTNGTTVPTCVGHGLSA